MPRQYLCLECQYEPTPEELAESAGFCPECGYQFTPGTLKELTDMGYAE